ncbi:MFS transporter [Chryseobacterium sp. JM1]|uniref:MFS transporter n=1 Tax=Chryseobacterium sp. JM1 TaxID=1233950 RepID=UPI00068A2FBD|nr:aromatic acid/H+ symport family MFS transporter [Chryseobacterium sp. JM1]
MKTINVQEIIDQARFNGFHKLLVFWCFIMIVFDVYDLVVFGVVLPVLMEEWNLTPVQAGALGSYALFGMMFGAFIFGALSDRIGRKICIVICMLTFTIFSFLVAFSTGPASFGIMRFVAGFGIGGLMPNAVALMTEYAPKKIRSLLTTLMFSGYAVGGILAACLGIWLIPDYGWKSLFYIGTLPILLIPLIIKSIPESIGFLVIKNKKDEVQKVLKKIEPNFIPHSDDQYYIPGKTAKVNIGQLFSNGRLISTLMFWITFFMCLLMVYGLNSWLPKLMTKAGYPLGSSLSFLLALNFGAMIGAIGGGWLGDKFHLRKVLIIFLSIAAVSLFLLGFKGSTIALYVLIAIAGATTIGTQILLYTYVAQFYPMDARSTGIGWASGVGRVGGIVGPLLGGYLISMNLPFQYNFLVFAIPGAIGALAICFVSLKYAFKNSVQSNEHPNLQTQPVHPNT